MDEVEIAKQKIIQTLKERIIELNNEITPDVIQNSTKDELLKYLGIMEEIKKELNLV